ncbi:DUF5009 domain-containing protein [Bacteroides ovatus]|nr:DUF5009 domain-containing protein [Bacteroides ovatus]
MYHAQTPPPTELSMPVYRESPGWIFVFPFFLLAMVLLSPFSIKKI